MKFQSRHNSTKKGFAIFPCSDVKAFHQVPLPSLVFPSRIITKNAQTHPHSMRDVIIEQSLTAPWDLHVEIFPN